MKILAVGESSNADLRFLRKVKNHEIDWFDTVKSASNRFSHSELAGLKYHLRQNRYDLIFTGRNPTVTDRLFPANLVSNLGRFAKYPKSFGSIMAGRLAGKTPLIVMDRGDSPVIGSSNIDLFKACSLYFKRELPANMLNTFLNSQPHLVSRTAIFSEMGSLMHKLRPVPIGFNADLCSKTPLDPAKTIDIFFAGKTERNPGRYEFFRALQDLGDQGIRIEISKERLDFATYLQKCASSYLVWSPEGRGWDCLRHYEVAYAGSVPVINYPWIRRYKPLRIGNTHYFTAMSRNPSGKSSLKP